MVSIFKLSGETSTAEEPNQSVGGFPVTILQYLTNSRSMSTDIAYTTRPTTRPSTTTPYNNLTPFETPPNFLAPTIISLAIIVVLLVMIILRQLSRRSQIMSSDGTVVVVRTESSQEEFRRLDNETDPNVPISTIYNPSMIHNEEPPDYDTLIQMELPSYEEITSK